MSTMLTVQEVAAQLGVSPAFVYRIKDRPDGIRAYRVGRCVRFKPEDVDAYLTAQTIQPIQPQQSYCKTRFRYTPGMKVV